MEGLVVGRSAISLNKHVLEKDKTLNFGALSIARPCLVYVHGVVRKGTLKLV